MAIEEACFEPARRGTEAHLLDVLRETGSIGAIATEEDRVVGFCMGAPLEFFREMEWVKDDPEFGRRTTLYAADLIVSPDHQRQGIGAALKANQIDRARRAGHLYITGRYRVRLAEGMGRISRKWGAYEVQYLRDSYADDLEPRDAVYYRIDL
jgi:predicted N-acetyltransferase YhbS